MAKRLTVKIGKYVDEDVRPNTKHHNPKYNLAIGANYREHACYSFEEIAMYLLGCVGGPRYEEIVGDNVRNSAWNKRISYERGIDLNKKQRQVLEGIVIQHNQIVNARRVLDR